MSLILLPRTLAVLVALTATAAAGAAAVRETGAYAVHYNALPSDRLDPELAERHGLPHSADRFVVTVAVFRLDSGRPVPAMIRGRATRPDGRMHALHIREIRERSGLYYVAELDAAASLDITLEVHVAGAMPPETIHFSRQFTSAEARQTDSESSRTKARSEPRMNTDGHR